MTSNQLIKMRAGEKIDSEAYLLNNQKTHVVCLNEIIIECLTLKDSRKFRGFHQHTIPSGIVT